MREIGPWRADRRARASNSRRFLLICLVILSFRVAPSAACEAAAQDAPGPAREAGYACRSFASGFSADVDRRDSRSRGYKWYVGKWFGYKPTHASDLATLPDGALEISDSQSYSNYSIATAAPARGGQGWVGLAFGGGGYFEAELKMNPADIVRSRETDFPAWWMLSLEHLAGLEGASWPGQPETYKHFAEIDAFEYNGWTTTPTREYRSSVHDWFGSYKETCATGFCDVSNFNGRSRWRNAVVKVADGFQFDAYHKYGALWTPATPSAKGSLTFFLDRRPVAAIRWSALSGQSPPSGDAPWTFGVIDQQHFVLILGTGDRKPFVVKSVEVWQAGENDNIRR